MDKIREEFERWASSVGFIDMLKHDEYGYQDHSVQAAWDAWQASRAYLIIELPLKSTFDDEESDGYNEAIDDCKKAIRSAGIEVK